MSDARVPWTSEAPTLLGVVHLLPLPGSPRPSAMDEVLARAEADTRIWFEQGVDGVVVENFGDVPFHARRVPPVTVAAMARALERVRSVARGAVGVNVLRNDAQAALGLCSAFDLEFLRINVHAGVTVTDQGLIEGEADATLRQREAWPGRPALLCDLDVKHGRPLVPRPLAATAQDLFRRAAADALLLTGESTGAAPQEACIDEVRQAVPEAPLLLASGVDPDWIERTRGQVQGWLVGTWAKRGGVTTSSPDPARVRELVAARKG